MTAQPKSLLFILISLLFDCQSVLTPARDLDVPRVRVGDQTGHIPWVAGYGPDDFTDDSVVARFVSTGFDEALGPLIL